MKNQSTFPCLFRFSFFTNHLILLIWLISLSAGLRAQVTIGGNEPPADGALLDLNKTVRGGLVLSNVSLDDLDKIPSSGPYQFINITAGTDDDINEKFKGALVYNTNETWGVGVYLWNGTNWTPLGENCLSVDNLTLTLKASSSTPSVGKDVIFSVSSGASARCAASETYTWSVFDKNGDATPSFPGIAGSTATKTIRFSTTGKYTVKVVVSNRYSASKKELSKDIFVGGIPADLKPDGFYLTGKPCYDIVKTDDDRSGPSRTGRVDAGLENKRARTYTFYHKAYSELSMTWEDYGGIVKSISSLNKFSDAEGDQTFTITFQDDVVAQVTDKAFSIKLLLSYKIPSDNTTKYVDMDIAVQDSICGCPVKKANTGNNSDWLVFQCHNLGGEDILTDTQAKTITQYHHGDWYKFGAREASLVNVGSGVGPILDWANKEKYPYLDVQALVEWSGAKNPCPAGWELPTQEDWQTVIDFHNSKNDVTNLGEFRNDNANFKAVKKIGSYLYLPAAGRRYYSSGSADNGKLVDRGMHIYCWSRDANNTSDAYYLELSGSGGGADGMTSRQHGMSVRCVSVE